MVQGLGFRVQGSGFKVQGSGFRKKPLERPVLRFCRQGGGQEGSATPQMLRAEGEQQPKPANACSREQEPNGGQRARDQSRMGN